MITDPWDQSPDERISASLVTEAITIAIYWLDLIPPKQKYTIYHFIVLIGPRTTVCVCITS